MFSYIRAKGPAVYIARPEGPGIDPQNRKRAESSIVCNDVSSSKFDGSEQRTTSMCFPRKIQTAGPLALYLSFDFNPSPLGWARQTIGALPLKCKLVAFKLKTTGNLH